LIKRSISERVRGKALLRVYGEGEVGDERRGKGRELKKGIENSDRPKEISDFEETKVADLRMKKEGVT